MHTDMSLLQSSFTIKSFRELHSHILYFEGITNTKIVESNSHTNVFIWIWMFGINKRRNWKLKKGYNDWWTISIMKIKELKITDTSTIIIKHYQKNWLEHLGRMSENQIPKGRWCQGCLTRTWDSIHPSLRTGCNDDACFFSSHQMSFWYKVVPKSYEIILINKDLSDQISNHVHFKVFTLGVNIVNPEFLPSLEACEIWDFHSNEDSNHGLLGYNTMQWCDRIPTLQRIKLPPSSGSSEWYRERGYSPCRQTGNEKDGGTKSRKGAR